MEKITSLCVYCGSSPGRSEHYVDAARRLGASMAANNVRLVYGGGNRGIMGAVARGVLDNGGQATGIIPEFLMTKERGGEQSLELTDLVVTQTMHDRKRIMFERADAFIALPGGIGTLEELFEILTWSQLARHSKPVGLLNTSGFWDRLIELIDHMKDEGFVHTAHLIRPVMVNEPEDVVAALNGSLGS
ncbi:MAG: TIGR00730 family Rossman fold protein [Pseudomonadota bacterium]